MRYLRWSRLVLLTFALSALPECAKDPSLKASESECAQSCAHVTAVTNQPPTFPERCGAVCMAKGWAVGDLRCLDAASTREGVMGCGVALSVLPEQAKMLEQERAARAAAGASSAQVVAPAPELFVEVSTKKLLADHNAKDTLKERLVQVSGIVCEVSRDGISGDVYVPLATDPQHDEDIVICHVLAKDAAIARTLPPGIKATVRGRVVGGGSGNVTLRHCQVITP